MDKPIHPLSIPRLGTPSEFRQRIELYYKWCDEKEWMPTKGNLAIYFGVSRETLHNYLGRPEYASTLSEVYTHIENSWVQKLKGSAVTGIIFYLKNAFHKDWKDRYDTDVTSGGKPIVLPSEIIKQNIIGQTIKEVEQPTATA